MTNDATQEAFDEWAGDKYTMSIFGYEHAYEGFKAGIAHVMKMLDDELYEAEKQIDFGNYLYAKAAIAAIKQRLGGVMPDISMCSHATCSKRFQCYRNKASGTKASDWQSYMDFKPDDKGECDDFWDRSRR